MQLIDLTETYVYGASKDLVSKKREIKCNNITKKCKIYYKEKHNSNWL